LLTVVFNYAVRLLVVLVGLAIATGALNSMNMDPTMQVAFGVVMAAFGLYRTVVYHVKRARGGEE